MTHAFIGKIIYLLVILGPQFSGTCLCFRHIFYFSEILHHSSLFVAYIEHFNLLLNKNTLIIA